MFHGLLSMVGGRGPVVLDEVVRRFSLTAFAKTDCRCHLVANFKKNICGNLAVLCLQEQSAIEEICVGACDGFDNFQNFSFVDHLIFLSAFRRDAKNNFVGMAEF